MIHQHNYTAWVFLVLLVLMMACSLGVLLYREVSEGPEHRALETAYIPMNVTMTNAAFSAIATPQAQQRSQQATQSAWVANATQLAMERDTWVTDYPSQLAATQTVGMANIQQDQVNATHTAIVGTQQMVVLLGKVTQTAIAVGLEEYQKKINDNKTIGTMKVIREFILLGMLVIGSIGVFALLSFNLWPHIHHHWLKRSLKVSPGFHK